MCRVASLTVPNSEPHIAGAPHSHTMFSFKAFFDIFPVTLLVAIRTNEKGTNFKTLLSTLFSIAIRALGNF